MRIFKAATRLIRVGSNCHRFIMLVNGKFRSFTTHEKDVLFDLAALFSMFNQQVFGDYLQGSRFWSFWIGLGLSILLSCPVSFALPTGWQVVSGDVTVNQNGNTLNVTSGSHQAIINYQSFDVAKGETVNFNFLLSGSSILNRVLGGGPSTIAGALSANGQVLLVNPAGINFANTANLNVGGLMASTLNIQNTDYLAGQYVFTKDPALFPGAVNNHGHIQADNYVALLGSSVKNDGSISAPSVALAVGDQMHVAVSPDLSLQVSVDQALKDQAAAYKEAIANTGSIQAQQVSLEAKVLEGKLYDSVVNNTGMIQATGATQDATGNIVLFGAGDDGAALVQNTGTLNASGTVASANGGSIRLEGDNTANSGQLLATGITGGQGGSVFMLGDSVMNLSGSTVNASGDQGGGTVLIGGDYQGKNASIRNASFNYMDANAKILANTETQGNGGKVVLWSDDKTLFQGRIETRGGAQGGNGGFVETSGHNVLRATGTVDASAPQGKGGQWLLDPNSISIQNSGSDTNISCSGGGPNTCGTTDDSAIVTDSTINASLNAGTDVVVQTNSNGANTQAGDITISAGTTINKTAGGDATLTLKANNSIISTGSSVSPVTIGSSSGKLNVVLNSDTDQGSDGGAGGAIKLSYTDITSNGGNITLGGGLNPLTTAALGTTANDDGILLNNSTLTSGVGNISLQGTGRSVAGNSNQWGVELDGGSQISATGGTIDLYGTGGAGATANYGVSLTGTNTKITSEDGTVTIHGTGGGTGINNYGVFLDNGGGTIIANTGTARLNITGQGSTSGTNNNHGITVSGTGTQITSVNGDVTFNGTGGGTGINNNGVFLSRANIKSTGTAKLYITGQGSTSGTANNYGVNVSASQISSVDGKVTIQATGGGNGTGSNNQGLVLGSTSISSIKSTGTAVLDINGTGGNGTDTNYGIYLNGTTSAYITGVNGNISLSGTGRGSGAGNYGLYMYNNAQISSTGSGTLTLAGTGGNGTNNNYGIYLDGNSNSHANIKGYTGDVSLTGTGKGTGTGNGGIYLLNGFEIISSVLGASAAKLDITGQGSTSGTATNYGVDLSGGSQITSADGDVTVQATGGGNGTNSSNYGLYLEGGSKIASTGTTSTGTAKLTINGTGGSGTSTNYGIYLNGANYITSVNGDIALVATGKGTVSNNYGLYLYSGAEIASTGTAKLNITGTGGNGTASNVGVYIEDGNAGANHTYITSATGDVTVQGTGKGSTTGNEGIILTSGGQINSTGSAKLSITGQGSTSGTSSNHGIFLNGNQSQITSVNGENNVTGTAGGTSSDNYGIYLNSANIKSTGTAELNVTGQGSTSGTANNHGLYLLGGSLITSADGNVSIYAKGGGSGTNAQNDGLYLDGSSKITSTGTASLGIFGTGGKGTGGGNNGVYLVNSGQISSLNGDITVNGTGKEGNNTNGITLENGGQITSTGSANITLTGIKGTGTGYGITSVTGSNVLGGSSMTGNLTLNTDSTSLSNLQISTAGNLTYKPHTSTTNIGINGGTGSLQVDTSLIDTSVVHPNKLIIGDSGSGSGTVTIGDGWDFSASSIPAVEVYGGSMTTGGVTAGSGTLLLRARTGNITLNNGAALSSTAAGDALILSGEGNFFNHAGSSALSTSSGRWLVYAKDPGTSNEGGLSASRLYHQTYAGNPPSSIAGAGNYFLYQNAVGSGSGGTGSSGTSSSTSASTGNTPSLLLPIVYSAPFASGSGHGFRMEQAPLLSPFYLFPKAQPGPSGLQRSSLTAPSLNTGSGLSGSVPASLEPAPQPHDTPLMSTPSVTGATSWALKLNTAGNTVRLLDVTTQQTLAEIPVGQQPVALVQNKDGNRAYVANEQDRTISVIDIPSQTVVQIIPVSTPPGNLELSADGQQLRILGQDGQLSTILDVSQLKVSP